MQIEWEGYKRKLFYVAQSTNTKIKARCYVLVLESVVEVCDVGRDKI